MGGADGGGAGTLATHDRARSDTDADVDRSCMTKRASMLS
jgi:hypothetical protein